MQNADLFPSELCAAQVEHQRQNGGDVCPPNSRCTVCYSAEEIADAESFDETFDHFDEHEPPEDLRSWQEITAEEVGIPLDGAL